MHPSQSQQTPYFGYTGRVSYEPLPPNDSSDSFNASDMMFNQTNAYESPIGVQDTSIEGWSGSYVGEEASYPTDYAPDNAVEVVEEGAYYECNRFIPAIRGAPVSAIACNLDGLHQEVDESMPKILYVASHCTSLKPTTPMLRGKSFNNGSSNHNRGAILAAHCLPSTACYSTVVGHREAERDTLLKVTAALTSTHSSALALTRNTTYHSRANYLNANAYRPPFGPLFTNFSSGLVNSQQPKDQRFQVGIRSIIALPSYSFKADQDYVVTASPSGVRMHTLGGMLVHDKPLPGTGCATLTPSYDSSPTHITVGALATSDSNSGSQISNTTNNSVVCLDLYGNLKPVLKVSIGISVVTCLETNQPRNAIIAGLEDGMLKVVDGSLRDWKTCMTTRHKGHSGGVSCIAISPDGNTIATAGLLSSVVDVFPDSQILLYDLRMFSRGGLPHRFSGAGGCPRFLSFLDTSTLLVASGQPGGGMQIMPTFIEDPHHHSLYIQPQYLSNNEERVTALHVDAQNIITVGTSHSQIMQFTASDQYMHPDMESPPYPPPPSGVELNPQQLHQSNSLGSGSIFGQYVIFSDACLSSPESFGKLEQQCIIPAPKRRLHDTIHEVVQLRSNDFLTTLPTKSLSLQDLLQFSHHQQPQTDHDTEGGSKVDGKVKRYNPNQLLFNDAAFKLAYDGSFVANRKMSEQKTPKISESVRERGDEDIQVIPARYRRAVRPVGSLSFSYSNFNETLLYPGWDCHERNVYVAPVLMLLYFIPEYRRAFQSEELQKRILEDAIAAMKRKPLTIFYEKGELIAELSFLFHQIDMLSTHALASQNPSPGVFSPKNFLATFTQMPEAAALNLFDSSPNSSSGAVAVLDLNKRAETFYRFLIHHLDSELGYASSAEGDCLNTEVKQRSNSKDSSRQRLVDSVQGMKVLTINTFPKAATPAVSETRALVLPLNYDNCFQDAKALPFGELLLSSLYMETSIKAYCKSSKTYENVIQQRSVCSLPKLLSVSASSAKKSDGTAQWWQQNNRLGGKWLPSQIDLEIIQEQKVVVRELLEGLEPANRFEWLESERSLCFPELYSKSVVSQKSRYKLFAVISFIHAEDDSSCQSAVDGHYVIHLCIPKAATSAILREQIKSAERCMRDSLAFKAWREKFSNVEIGEGVNIPCDFPHLTVASQVAPDTLSQRARSAKDRLSGITSDQWILFNGIAVSLSSEDEARDFERSFKEPSLIFFRAVDDDDTDIPFFESDEASDLTLRRTERISNELFLNGEVVVPLPKGGLMAVDSEAVLVAHAESVLTDVGSRLTRADGRYALARLSLFDCRSSCIFVDDYVMPKEKVVDYLTRFSGILPEDLDSSNSIHNIVTMRVAYLKLRVLMQRGCIFVGHGLDKDLEVINMFIPPYQLIDTVNIFRKENSRKISLRFLANYLLGRDMQQDTHDSVEDAKIAYEIYLTALRLMSQGRFRKILDEIYEYGRKNEWRLGVDD